MNEELKTILEADERKSASKIAGQLKQIQAMINAQSRIAIDLEIGNSQSFLAQCKVMAESGVGAITQEAKRAQQELSKLAQLQNNLISRASNVGRFEKVEPWICPPQSGGNAERAAEENGFCRKGLRSKCLKWCA